MSASAVNRASSARFARRSVSAVSGMGQVVVDQLFAARNLGQIERSLGCRIQTADMRHHITAGSIRPDAVSSSDSIISAVLPPVVPITCVWNYSVHHKSSHLARELLVGRPAKKFRQPSRPKHGCTVQRLPQPARSRIHRQNRCQSFSRSSAAGFSILPVLTKCRSMPSFSFDLGRREQRLGACQDGPRSHRSQRPWTDGRHGAVHTSAQFQTHPDRHLP